MDVENIDKLSDFDHISYVLFEGSLITRFFGKNTVSICDTPCLKA